MSDVAVQTSTTQDPTNANNQSRGAAIKAGQNKPQQASARSPGPFTKKNAPARRSTGLDLSSVDLACIEGIRGLVVGLRERKRLESNHHAPQG
jgi:hypothetical protein